MNKSLFSCGKDDWEIPKLSRGEVVTQLRSLAEDRKSFFSRDGYDEAFREDFAACIIAAELLEQDEVQTCGK